MKEILKKKIELDLSMPVKMEWDNTTMVSAMGMDWDDATTDIALLDLPTLEFTTDSDPYFSPYNVNLFDTPLSPKHQIISHDCMWSGTCGDKSHPGKTHPLNTPCSTATSIVPSSNTNTNNNVNSCKLTNTNKITLMNQQPQQVVKQQQVKQDMKIPAGRSLLRNFNNNNNNNSLTNSSSKQSIRSNDKNGTNTRPDTPLSLDDDSPEFKHHIDLAGTIAGTMNNQFSNGRKISICANNDDSSHIIGLLREHLEDDDMQGQKSGQILEILSNTFGGGVHHDVNGQSDNVLDYLKYLSDYEGIDEEDDSAVDLDSDSDEYTSSSSGYGCSSSLMKNTDKYHSSSCISSSSSTNSNNNAQLSHVPVPYDYQETHFGDHSYTRPKDRFDTRDLGVQTPSDSEEEEIDVVSVGDRTLPTNPSARDRRHLQTAVAHKISARMVKTQKNGLRTIPPRRRCSNDDSPNSSSTNTPVKHFINSTGNPNYTAMPTVPSSLASKKRPSSNGISSSNNKKHRSNNGSHSISSSNNSSSNKKQKTPNKRNFSDSDELETLEKRNLHNDMERQRRIGLKNLFEELKSTIPSIKDKERAPKVNILREAASLCNKLTREHDQYQALKKQQTKLLAKVKQLRASIANKREIIVQQGMSF